MSAPTPDNPNRNIYGIPKFTCTKSLPGHFSQGTFVYHNGTPLLVGKVMNKEGGGIYIQIIRNPENADDETVKTLTAKMSKWYYSNYGDKAESKA